MKKKMMVEFNPNMSVFTSENLLLKDKDSQMEKMIKSNYLYEAHLKHKNSEIL